MSAFEFFFTLYGLVLGLSVVEIVSGFARLAHDRRGVKIGWLTPMLAALMLLDLAWFWVSAYRRFQDYELSYGLLVITLTMSSLYYVAASVVFPRDFSQEPDFDAVYMRHRRLVFFVLLIVGVVVFDLVPMLTAEGRAQRLAQWTDLGALSSQLLWFAAIPIAMLSGSKRVNMTVLVILISQHLISVIRTLPQ